jgi:hypothetical protein
LIENKKKGGNFELNPFNSSQENVLGLSSSFRNSLFYNRGKQKHSVTYLKMKQNLLSIGSQDSQNSSHQIQYSHLYKKSWLFGTFAKTIQTDILKILLKKLHY